MGWVTATPTILQAQRNPQPAQVLRHSPLGLPDAIKTVMMARAESALQKRKQIQLEREQAEAERKKKEAADRMAMAIQLAMKNALDTARNCRRYGSVNKRYAVPARPGPADNVTVASQLKRQKALARNRDANWAKTVLAQVRAQQPGDKAPVSEWLKYAQVINDAGVGNCMELAIVAFKSLVDSGVAPIYLAGLGSNDAGTAKGDHVFVIVGKPGVNWTPQAGWGRDYSKWGPGVCIIDPWANILCAAADYPMQWKLKLSKWAKAGKQLHLGNDVYGNPFFDKNWRTAIETYNVVFLGLQA